MKICPYSTSLKFICPTVYPYNFIVSKRHTYSHTHRSEDSTHISHAYSINNTNIHYQHGRYSI